jgi:hypothetical protein
MKIRVSYVVTVRSRECHFSRRDCAFGYGGGVLPDFPARPDGVIDFIPADFVVSTRGSNLL